MSTMPDHVDDARSPLVTLSALDVPVTAERSRDGSTVYLLLGPATLILLPGQAADVVTALSGVAPTDGATADRSDGS